MPPLATAFLVGYFVNVLFSFLDGLVRPMDKSRTEDAEAAK